MTKEQIEKKFIYWFGCHHRGMLEDIAVREVSKQAYQAGYLTAQKEQESKTCETCCNFERDNSLKICLYACKSLTLYGNKKFKCSEWLAKESNK